MNPLSLASPSTSSRSALQTICAVGAAGVGLAFLLAYVVPNLLAGSSALMVELVVFVAIVALLSILAAIGYWMQQTWGWLVHLASVLGQLFFPGSLFEFKPDLYHLIGWVGPLFSLVMLIAMWMSNRRERALRHD